MSLRDWVADDKWVMNDKLDHIICGGVLWYLLSQVMPTLPYRIITFQALGIFWEVIELYRYMRWDKRGAWPFATDKFSWRDLIANNIGALLVWLLPI